MRSTRVTIMAEYSLHDYGKMIRDRVRTDAYALALERLVRPGSVVLDLGAGSGILTLLAARCGARRVFAVEAADVIELAQAFAAANGVADRVDFFQSISTQVALPEPADVIVSDIHGILPLYRSHIPSIIDARRRHLARAGTLTPFRDTLWVAPAELESVYEDGVSWWETRPYDFEIAAARAFAANTWRRISAPADALLAHPERLAVIDYQSISGPDIKSSAELEAIRGGTVHGLIIWFDSELAQGVGFSNAPGDPEKIYGQAFFPLLEPVVLTAGDVISFEFSASLFGDEYVFRWDTRIAEPSNPRRVKAAFTQSTLLASPITPETLATSAENYAPKRTEECEAVGFVLQRVNGRLTLRDLSLELEGRFPKFFASAHDARSFVTKVTRRYCR
jgi:protein arginine N-methyltransferase 1